MNENSNVGRPILPIRNSQRVTVWRGEVYVAPLGYTCMGPGSGDRLWASNGSDMVEMVNVGRVLDE